MKEEFVYPEQSTLNGNSESPAGMGGGQKTCTCQGPLMSIGGIGGAPVVGGQPGSNGFPDLGAGQGGTPNACSSGGGGNDGADAAPASAAAGAEKPGTVDSSGWHPQSGEDGVVGQPGQGGGGGASRNESGHGGGGGCGSCGGNGATKGFGGGASIGLLAFESDVALENVNLIANDAGNGGDGKAGQPGQQDVGAGGNAISALNSCDGGTGGRGGNGGASGGGAGGISVGIVWAGEAAPSQLEVTIEVGTAGEGGIGGEPGVNDGTPGVAHDTHEAN